MNNLQKYILFKSFKDFVRSIIDTYEDNEASVHILDEYLHHLNLKHPLFDTLINAIVEFCNLNEDCINGREPLKSNLIKCDDSASIDIAFYLNKQDDNTDIIYDHLTSIIHFYHGSMSKEEEYLNRLLAQLKSNCHQLVDEQLMISDHPDSESPSDEAIEAIGESLRPNIEDELSNFQNLNLNLDNFVKILCFKTKDYLNENDLPGENIDKSQIVELLDMAIEKDLDELMTKKFEIFAALSGSGLLANFPVQKLMQIATSF